MGGEVDDGVRVHEGAVGEGVRGGEGRGVVEAAHNTQDGKSVNRDATLVGVLSIAADYILIVKN